MNKSEIIDKVAELAELFHKASMKHINADRMGDSYLRSQGNELEDQFQIDLDKFAQKLVDRMKTKV